MSHFVSKTVSALDGQPLASSEILADELAIGPLDMAANWLGS